MFLNKTKTVTLLSAAIILTFTMIEFVDYRRVTMETSMVVDKSRGETRQTVPADGERWTYS